MGDKLYPVDGPGSRTMLSIKIFPQGPTDLGVQVLVYPTREDMHAGLVAWDCTKVDYLTEAMCVGLGGPTDVCCALFFYLGDCGLSIISHECWHATFRWLKSTGVKRISTSCRSEYMPQDAPEELGAYYHGLLVESVFHEIKLYRKIIDAQENQP